MYAYVAASTGWTWEYIGECLTLPRLYALQKHWRVYPPVHVMAALFAGYKPPSDGDMSKPAPISRADEVKQRLFADELPILRIVRPR